MDDYRNFVKGPLAAGYDANATSIDLEPGYVSRFPTVPFNCTWYNATDYPDPADDPYREIVRCTNIVGDTLMVSRAQEGTTNSVKNFAGKTYYLMAGVTAKTIDDILDGIIGPTGYTGVTGYTGLAGTAGGPTGYTGYTGPGGIPGGPTGYTGFSGYTGYSGATGYSGYTGFTGYSGTTGYTGYTGYSGTTGYTGYSGYSGYSGYTGYGTKATAYGVRCVRRD